MLEVTEEHNTVWGLTIWLPVELLEPAAFAIQLYKLGLSK